MPHWLTEESLGDFLSYVCIRDEKVGVLVNSHWTACSRCTCCKYNHWLWCAYLEMASKCLKEWGQGMPSSLAWQTRSFPEPCPFHAFSVPHFCAAHFALEQQGALLFSCCGSSWSTFLYLWWEAHTCTPHPYSVRWWAIEGQVGFAFSFLMLTVLGFIEMSQQLRP